MMKLDFQLGINEIKMVLEMMSGIFIFETHNLLDNRNTQTVTLSQET